MPAMDGSSAYFKAKEGKSGERLSGIGRGHRCHCYGMSRLWQGVNVDKHTKLKGRRDPTSDGKLALDLAELKAAGTRVALEGKGSNSRLHRTRWPAGGFDSISDAVAAVSVSAFLAT